MSRRHSRSEPGLMVPIVVLVLAVAVTQDWLGVQVVASEATLWIGHIVAAVAVLLGEMLGAALQPALDGLTSGTPEPTARPSPP